MDMSHCQGSRLRSNGEEGALAVAVVIRAFVLFSPSLERRGAGGGGAEVGTR